MGTKPLGTNGLTTLDGATTVATVTDLQSIVASVDTALTGAKSDATTGDTSTLSAAKTYTDQQIPVKALPFRGRATGTTHPGGVDSIKTPGIYEIANSTDSSALGLPIIGQGSLVVVKVHNYLVQEYTMVGNGEAHTRTRLWTGSAWWAWANSRWENTSALTGSTNIDALPSGIHPVRSGSAAAALGLPASKGFPTPSSGSLMVHNVDPSTGRREWRPTPNNEVWGSQKHGGAWGAWELIAGGSETRTGEITGASLTLVDTGQNFIPHSVGVDGYVYGSTTSTAHPIRSGDGFASTPEQGPNMSTIAGPGEGIRYVTKTSSGYLIIWRTNESTNSVWHSPDWMGPYTKVLDMGPYHYTGLAAPVLINGATWFLLGEYTNSIKPSFPCKRFLSTDGGMTWKMIRETPLVDTTVNSHCHTGLIRPSGRVYVSDGDGVNNWFGYSDDQGESWIKVDTDPDVQIDEPYTSQPTVMIDHGDRITLSPDRGPYSPGMWTMDPNTHRMEITYNLSAGGPYNDASKQYGRGVLAQVGPQGKEAYVMMPDGGSGNKTTYIVATPDGGRRWGIVATIPEGTTGELDRGIIGPDRTGQVFMRGIQTSTYGSNIIKGRLIDWGDVPTV